MATIIAGDEPPASIIHTIFGVFEVSKVAALAVIGHLAHSEAEIAMSPVDTMERIS